MATKKQSKPSRGSSRTTNRLIDETSPYLLQHAHNPVDWHGWGQEALSKSKKQDKPILLSIGYAACHWCHVMEHESFEDQSTAALMNENFINIKVDREERPDLDDIYMKAVQLMTGHGGWPMTVFLTPQLKPFFGGTYFPPEDRHGMPSFKRVLLGVAQAWDNQREQLEQSSTELTQYLLGFDKAGRSTAELDNSLIDAALARILQIFDHQWGGLGNAPKFPHASSLSLAMRCAAPAADIRESRRQECLEYVTTTLDKMAYGGMHDQIGGGFARYSVDRKWLVPHFEKMLYDNAMLSQAYLDGFALIGRSYWKQVAGNCLEFVLRELTTEDGAFYSSLDADSEGEEGKFYVFKPEEVAAALGEEDGQWVSEIYGVTPGGNFEHGASVLHLSASPEDLSKKYRISVDEFWARLRPLDQKLLQARSKKVRPGRDEKVLTSWNGLMISGFIKGYKLLQDDRYLEAARRATNFILSKMYVKGRLLRTWGQGKAKLNGYLDDYAFVVSALLDLSEVDCDPRWFQNASKIAATMLKHFFDEEEQGFFYTSDDHEELITRPKSYFDGSTPSGSSVAVMDLLRLSRLTGDDTLRQKAAAILQLYAPHVSKSPDQFANLLCALDFYLAPPTEIAILADVSQPDWKKMLFKVHSFYLPNVVTLVADQSSSQQVKSLLIEGRSPKDQATTVYICKNYACQEPLVDYSLLESRVKELAKA